jgi:hypothetical protein
MMKPKEKLQIAFCVTLSLCLIGRALIGYYFDVPYSNGDKELQWRLLEKQFQKVGSPSQWSTEDFYCITEDIAGDYRSGSYVEVYSNVFYPVITNIKRYGSSDTSVDVEYGGSFVKAQDDLPCPICGGFHRVQEVSQ